MPAYIHTYAISSQAYIQHKHNTWLEKNFTHKLYQFLYGWQWMRAGSLLCRSLLRLFPQTLCTQNIYKVYVAMDLIKNLSVLAVHNIMTLSNLFSALKARMLLRTTSNCCLREPDIIVITVIIKTTATYKATATLETNQLLLHH